MKMNVARILLMVLCLSGGLQAQDNRVLMNIGGDDVTVDEFLGIYNKNNTNNVVDKKTMNEYVELFVNFKLKVKEAESLGMDTNAKFVRELGGYRNQLAQPYLIDKSVNDQLIQEAYDRMNQDVAAYHILVRVAPDASGADTLKALNRLKSLSKNIRSEVDMQATIAKLSANKDENVIAENLGYFTAFSMVYPFENAAYNTNVGELSKPIRTRFGYHVVFVKDKRAARGEIRVSHIFIRSTNTDSEDQKATAEARIREISSRLKTGDSFDDLVKEFSEDKASVSKGGMLPWFGTGGTASVFEEASFSLKENGDLSDPVLSNYGWHIIRREDQRGIAEFDKLKSTIKKRIEKDTRALKGRTYLLKQLKKDYALTYNHTNRKSADKNISNDLLAGKWKMNKELKGMDAVLFTVSDNLKTKKSMSFTQEDYLTFIQKVQKPRKEGEMLSSVLPEYWNAFVNEMLIRFEDSILEMKHPEFKALMQEYHDGILLFDLMDQKVWSKAVKDTSGLEAFYEAHKSEYMWPERADASIYSCANDDVVKATMKLAKKRVKKSLTDADIMKEVNANNPLDLSIRSGLFSQKEDDVIKVTPWSAGIHDLTIDGKRTVVQVYDILQPTPKALIEARGLITSAYQSQLEDDWIVELRGKYPFEVDQKVFDSINK